MKLGVSSYAFGWGVGLPDHTPAVPFTEIDLLGFARAHGLDLVQIGDHLPLHAFPEARLARLQEAAAADQPVELEIGARGLTDAHLNKFINLARRLRSPLLRFVIDGPGFEPDASEVIASIRTALPLLEDARVVLGIENHDRFPARTLRRMMEEINSPWVGICLDTANSLGAGEGLEQVLGELARHTVNLHVKDFAIRRVHSAMGFVVEGRPAGRGQLDLPRLLRRVAREQRCRSVILEIWTPPEPELAQTITKERLWAEASIAYLKPLFVHS